MKPYVVHLWDCAAPADWEQALQVLANPHRPMAARSEKLAALASKLELLHPVQPSPDCFWAEDLTPPPGLDWALALSPRWLGRALNLLVLAAREQGLLVFDAEQQILVLHEGRVLRPEGASEWQPWAEEPLAPRWLTNQHFEAEQRRLLLPWLERWGFGMGVDEGGTPVFTRSTQVACSSRAGLLGYPQKPAEAPSWFLPNFALLALARLEGVPDFDERAAALIASRNLPEAWLQRALAPIRAWQEPSGDRPEQCA